ncbi:hypothetical protein K2173_018738 [Erythroxylum novogranatense]|uniref:RING-type domain-containing protein n=1 Tax=Erythroxylum novogranatense TaxID=1862640 RepID=A0AAV8SAT6_9ROSI|nr:hypothetical protein K2173_018738 [Erythroxylum novogranatense]
MNGLDGIRNWKILKRRLWYKGLGCCGASWSPRTIIEEAEHEQDDNEEEPIMLRVPVIDREVHTNVGHIPVRNSANVSISGMNLAAALAAERNLAGPAKNDCQPAKTLMRLIEETDGVDLSSDNDRRDKDHSDWGCCVCMVRSKGAAFIPCGHAFCRACSRELWANRGSCPICNRTILEILDIF